MLTALRFGGRGNRNTILNVEIQCRLHYAGSMEPCIFNVFAMCNCFGNIGEGCYESAFLGRFKVCWITQHKITYLIPGCFLMPSTKAILSSFECIGR